MLTLVALFASLCRPCCSKSSRAQRTTACLSLGRTHCSGEYAQPIPAGWAGADRQPYHARQQGPRMGSVAVWLVSDQSTPGRHWRTHRAHCCIASSWCLSSGGCLSSLPALPPATDPSLSAFPFAVAVTGMMTMHLSG
jgi:hypothetical protein